MRWGILGRPLRRVVKRAPAPGRPSQHEREVCATPTSPSQEPEFTTTLYHENDVHELCLGSELSHIPFSEDTFEAQKNWQLHFAKMYV